MNPAARRVLKRINCSRRDPSFAARPGVMEEFAARPYVGGANCAVKLMLVSF